jgi:S1-C subfamily serine protease
MRHVYGLLAGALFLLAVIYFAPPQAARGTIDPENSTVIVSLAGGHGSGVYLGNGLILTAAHVAKEAADGKMSVEDIQQTKGTAVVLWYNADADVALLKLDGPMTDFKGVVDVLPPAKLSCATPDVKIGDDIEVIGAPLNLKYIHTYGRVASEVTARIATGEGPQINFLADVTAAPGNSGGPAFDKDGNLVGIVVAIVTAPLQGGLMMPIPSIVRLTYIIPKSVICKELSTHK